MKGTATRERAVRPCSTARSRRPAGPTLTGDTDFDTFDLDPQTTTAFTVYGDVPHGTPTGDKLIMTIPAAGTSLTVTDFGRGTFGFSGAGAPQSVSYWSIEELQVGGGQYDLIVNLSSDYDGDNVADRLRVALDGTGTRVVIERTGDADGGGVNPNVPANRIGTLYQDLLTAVRSLQVIGSGDVDSLTIDDVNGLPGFSGPVPGTLNNPQVGDPGMLPNMLFAAGGGSDALQYVLRATTDQTYGPGDGAGGGFGADTPDGAEGEVLTVKGTRKLDLYFTGLESPVTTSGTPGGTLTVVGDAEDQVLEVDRRQMRPASAGRPASPGCWPTTKTWTGRSRTGMCRTPIWILPKRPSPA